MTEKEFEKEIDKTLKQLRKTLVVKGREYRRNSNPFHNFEMGSKMTGLSREKVLDGMLLKHEISIADMTNDLSQGILPLEEIVHEKFNDNIIYLLLKKASILDKINKKTN